MWQFCLVFIAMFANDTACASYILAIEAVAPYRAAFWSAAIVILEGFAIVSYASAHWLIIPAVLGALTGTFFIVKRESNAKTE